MRQFLKQTFASLIGSLAGLILFFVLGTGGLALLLMTAVLREDGPTVQDKSVLVFDLSTRVSDTQPPSTIATAISGEDPNTLTLRQVLDTIEKATDDQRIVALFLDGSRTAADNPTGYATLKEVRTALERFKSAGKKIIAYDVDWGEKEYYLGSVADTVVLNPMGTIVINGLSSQQTFFAGALEKYGVGVQVIRAGKYKSAVEPFTDKQFSPENRQQIRELLDDLWGEFITTAAESRKLTPEKLQAIADNKGFLLSPEARSSGLVDQVAYFDQVIADLKQLTGEGSEDESLRDIRFTTYANVPLKSASQRSSNNKIAVVYAEGAIVTGQGGVQEVGSDRFAQQLRQLREDDAIKALVLRVNSPGGSATASEIILREVQLVAKKKPVIVSMGDVAASGGYWIATGAEQIFAEPNTITGSIGVFGLLPNIEELANKNGITWDIVTTAKLADADTITRPKTEQELAIYQQTVNQIYDQFLSKVAKSRNLPIEKVAQIAQGRVWSGLDAKQIGLVDQIGGIDAAIEFAALKAELGDDWESEKYPEHRSLEERILKRFVGEVKSQQAQQLDPLTAEFLQFKADLTSFQALNDPRGIYTRLPFGLRID